MTHPIEPLIPMNPAASFFRVIDLPAKEVLDGIRLRSVSLADLMMSFVEYDAGSAVPTHRHRREQITYVLDGFLEVTIATERRVLGPGEGVRIPRQTDHSSRPVGGPARAIDAWTPVPERLKVEEPSTLGEHVPLQGESPV